MRRQPVDKVLNPVVSNAEVKQALRASGRRIWTGRRYVKMTRALRFQKFWLGSL